MKHTSKAEREQIFFLKQQKEASAANALRFSRKRFKRFDDIIESLYNGENLSDYYTDRRIWKIHEAFNTVVSKPAGISRAFIKAIFIYLHQYSGLMETEGTIHAVCNMMRFKPYWKREISNWKPVSKKTASQVIELAKYLFCRYEVPEFLYKAFHEQKNLLFIKWFIHIGNGGKVKEIENVPVPFTNKAGHYFLQGPSMLSIPEALRWAQAKALGADDNLAKRIAYSWLSSKPYSNEEFWNSFLRLVINGGMFNHDKLTELIDYVREKKRADISYSLKGRTLTSLFRQSDQWHRRFSGTKRFFEWKPCGIGGLSIEKKELIKIEELTDSRQLALEGQSMKHCVASYSSWCARGDSAIFTMRKYADGVLLEILATIEVNLVLKKVVQAKAKANRMVSEEAKKYMAIWVERESLSIGPYI